MLACKSDLELGKSTSRGLNQGASGVAGLMRRHHWSWQTLGLLTWTNTACLMTAPHVMRRRRRRWVNPAEQAPGPLRVRVVKCQIYEKWQMTRTWRLTFSRVDLFRLGLRSRLGQQVCRWRPPLQWVWPPNGTLRPVLSAWACVWIAETLPLPSATLQ